ncbi:RING finger protein 44 [Platysternon megacephalum]|uniref:RING finger protein 44 n=1 Tax=Platysternon megacephalum TaxID=55544 RepID=A0A4D9E0W9_9SAUR|nr:RING finger protein 44 [Platysternon megacephalum]
MHGSLGPTPGPGRVLATQPQHFPAHSAPIGLITAPLWRDRFSSRCEAAAVPESHPHSSLYQAHSKPGALLEMGQQAWNSSDSHLPCPPPPARGVSGTGREGRVRLA